MQIKKGSTDRTVELFFADSTTGLPKTGLAYNSSGIDLWYRRPGAAKTSLTEATLSALTDAHADGGFLEIANGWYRLDLPDAAFSTGVPHVLIGGTVTGAVCYGVVIELVDFDPQDTVRLGLTALPNAAAEAAGGLYTRGSGAGQINQPANGMIDANVVRNAGTAITASSGRQEVNVTHYGGTAGTFSSGIPSVNAAQISGDATAADNAESFFDGTGYAGTNNVIPTVTTTTNLTNKGDGSGFTAIPWNASWDAEVQSECNDALVANGLDHLLGASVTGTDVTDNSIIARLVSKSATADWDTFNNTTDSLEAIVDNASAPSAATIADAVWDEARAGHTTASTFGYYLDAAISGVSTGGVSAGDIADAVWDEVLSGHTTSGTAGERVGRIPNAAAGGNGGLPTVNASNYIAGLAGTINTLDALDTAQDSQHSTTQGRLPASLVSGRIDASVGAMASSVLTATAIASDAITAAKVAADVTTEIQSGLATSSALSTAQTDLTTLTTRLSSSRAGYLDYLNIGGNVASSGNVATIDAKIDTIDNFIDTEVAAIKAVTDKLDTAMELDSSVYRFTTNALEQAPTGGSAPTAAAIADAVWDELKSGHNISGSFGDYLDMEISDVTGGGGGGSGGPVEQTPVAEEFTVTVPRRGSTNLAPTRSKYVQASEKVRFAIDFVNILHEGDAISEIVSITEDTGQSITLTPIGVCGTQAKFWVEDALPSLVYRVECKVDTMFGLTLEGDFLITSSD